MTRLAHQHVVHLGTQSPDPAANGFPELFDSPNGFRMGRSGWRDDANGIHEKCGARGGHAGFLGTCHGMTADKMRSRAGNDFFQIANHADLDAADVGYDGARFEGRRHFDHERLHLSQWRAENDEIGALNSGPKIASCVLNYAKFTGFGDAGVSADEADDAIGEAPFLDGKAQRTTEQTDPHDRDLPEMHTQRIEDETPGRKMEDQNRWLVIVNFRRS